MPVSGRKNVLSLLLVLSQLLVVVSVSATGGSKLVSF